MTPIKRFAPTVSGRATGGPCALCDAPATVWHRTGLCAGGLVRAVYACTVHDDDARRALHEMSLDDVVAITRDRRRTAERSRARAARLAGVSDAYSARSAALRGASSLTHTAALMSGAAAREAEALLELADALDDEEIMDLAVAEVRAYRAEKAKG